MRTTRFGKGTGHNCYLHGRGYIATPHSFAFIILAAVANLKDVDTFCLAFLQELYLLSI